MAPKGFLIVVTSVLICACSGDVKNKTIDAYDSNTQYESRSAVSIQDIEVGKAFSLQQLNRLFTFDHKLKKLSDVECGGFFTEEEGGGKEEAVYQYGRMIIHIMGDQGIITQIIGIRDGFHIRYGELWFDNTFDPETLNSRKFEVYKNKATISDNTINIESTNIKANYDLMYSVREVSSDDLLYLYFLNHKLVAVKVLVQC